MEQQVSATGELTVLVHYTYPIKDSSGDGWRIACMPNMTEFHQTPHHPNYQRSSDVRGVSCQACKKTAVFRRDRETLEKVLGGSIYAR